MTVPGQAYEDGQQCTHGWGKCGRTDTHPYAAGARCPAHTPAALAGLPEPDAKRYCPPYICYCKTPECAAKKRRVLTPVTDNVVDFRHKASGKRRSSPAAYQEAQRTRTRGAAS